MKEKLRIKHQSPKVAIALRSDGILEIDIKELNKLLKNTHEL